MARSSVKHKKLKTHVILNMFGAAFGLFFFGFGVYLTIQADIGAGPWDVLSLGIAEKLGISYGTAAVSASIVILCIDILLNGKIGIGMLLDAFIVGKSVDLFNYLDVVSLPDNKIISVICIIAGLIIEGLGQYLYMRSALGCGPRDTLMVELKKRLPKIPIGLVSSLLMIVATLIGWLLGGKLGIGTILCAVLAGPVMQYEFSLLNFKAEEVRHQDIVTSLMILTDRI